MNDFEPYHKWFGIPSEIKNPNHYQLLGITLLEGDAEIIEAAAEQRLLFLRSVQNGPHGRLAQKLCNEIMAARSLLLNPERKAKYDAFIGSGSDSSNAPSQASGRPLADAQPGSRQPHPSPSGAIESAADQKSPPGSILPQRSEGKPAAFPAPQISPEQVGLPLRASSPTPAPGHPRPSVDTSPSEAESATTPQSVTTTPNTPSISTGAGRSGYRKKKQKPNPAVQVAIFAVPSLVLILMLTVFSETTFSLLARLRGGGEKPAENEAKKKSSDATPPKKIASTKKKNSPKESTENSKEKSASAKTENLSPGKTPETASPQSPPKEVKRENPVLEKKLEIPNRTSLAPFLEALQSSPTRLAIEYFEQASTLTVPAEEFAHLSYGMDTAVKEENLEVLVHGFDRMEERYQVDWASELLERILKMDLTSSPNNAVALAALFPDLMHRCRRELCVETGIELAAKMEGLALGQALINSTYVQQQIKVLRSYKEFEAAGDSMEKNVFDAMFTGQLDLLARVDNPASRNFANVHATTVRQIKIADQQAALEFQWKEFKTAKKKLESYLKNEANRILLDEIHDEVDQSIKTAIINMGRINREQKSSVRYDSNSSQIHQACKLESSDIGYQENRLPLLIRHRHRIRAAGPVSHIGFTGEKSRFVIMGDIMSTVAPLKRRSKSTRIKPIGNFGNIVEHHEKYFVAESDGNSVVWRDIISGEKVQGKIDWPARPGSRKKKGIGRGLQPANQRIRSIAFASPRGDVAVLRKQTITFVKAPFSGSQPSPIQDSMEIDLEEPTGMVSNQQGYLALIGSREIVILDGKIPVKRIALDLPVLDASFRMDTQGANFEFYYSTAEKLHRIDEKRSLEYDIPGVNRVCPLSGNHFLLARQLPANRMLIQVGQLEGIEKGNGYVQQLAVKADDVRLSWDGKFVATRDSVSGQIASGSAFGNRESMELYSVVWSPNSP